MKKEITELRKLMKDAGVDAYYVPYGDFHCSEYVSDHFKVTEFLSGFTGEAATLVINGEGAWLWTDGRFFIQAEQQLEGSGISLMKMKEEGVPEVPAFITELAVKKASREPGSRFVLGFDGRVVPAATADKLAKCFEEAGADVMIRSDTDLAGSLWTDRPGIEAGKIWELPLWSAGISAEDKLAAVRDEMKMEGADLLLLSDLMETAWLFDLRGSDILYTPVFYSFTLITQDSARLYVMDQSGTGQIPLPEGTQIKAYDEVYEDLAGLGSCAGESGSDRAESIWLDRGTCNQTLISMIPDDIEIIDKPTAAAMMKIVKNDTEIGCEKNAHIKDGVAVTKLICRLKKYMKDEDAPALTETGVADMLLALRAEQEDFIELSFETIAAYGANAAIVHYVPTAGSDAVIRPEGFLLLDSGGQYIDGTTDITRTIAVGPLTQEMIDDYTYVLKAHISMAMAKVSGDISGTDIDAAARAVLKEHGLDFNHGLSHGVGHVLGVHEGPNAIARKAPGTKLRSGMIMSNEPGVYMEGRFGIRTENLVCWRETEDGSLVNEALTCVPYERDAINIDLLTEEEIAWTDSYHRWVRETLTPFLDEETAEFVREATMPLKTGTK